MSDDWLEDDLREYQPKKKRRLQTEHDRTRGEETAAFSVATSQNRHSSSNTACRGKEHVLLSLLLLHTVFCKFTFIVTFFFQLLQFPPPPAGVSL